MATTCSLTQNLPIDCRQTTGGIKSIFVTNLLNQSVAPVSSGGTVTAYSLTAGSGAKFFRYDFRKATGEFTETSTLSDPNWTIFYAGDIKIQFTKLEVNKQQELHLLAQNDLIVIVLDNNGQYWLCATTNGATLTKVDGKTGKNFGDLNGYQLEIKYQEPLPALLLPSSFIPALTTPA
jgi:hypothetical protein